MLLRISMLAYVVLQFIAFFFVLVGTPIDMFRQSPVLIPEAACLTLWGSKVSCSAVRYDLTAYNYWYLCPKSRQRWRSAELFAILSIFVYGTAVIFGYMRVYFCGYLRWVCLALNVAGIITLGIVWGLVVYVYHVPESINCISLKDFRYHFGAGLVLFLIAWCLNIINIVFLMIPCEASVSIEPLEHELSVRPKVPPMK
ncbi:amastin-like protein [Leishmania mexicana MHOM/GT/2001/U1103]|uniref:Amastin-like protein n=1 Tax=Leishmania mexicana (strain MHOM/GT/2001/U1103) TaxID=929439 RepID=E9B4L9_LEIMU|nr:amastin-like protein [Leishmania mexicana MHOM/GT/2001/U1103]CBZ30188.1 amastin-like protein [Leishmania mexicana MHOM/GT/2001/U1103]